MTRFDYLRAHERPSFRYARWNCDARMRRALLAVAASSVVCCGVGGIQGARVTDAARRVQALSAELAGSDARVRLTRRTQADVQRLERIVAGVRAVRRRFAQRSGEIAWIGNRLPNDAWLSSLRAEGGAYDLEGGARSVNAVARLMRALANGPAGRTPRLVSIGAGQNGAAGSIRYVIRFEAVPR